VKFFFILFSFCFISFSAATAAQPLYESFDDDSITVFKDPKRVSFDYIVLYPESNAIIRYEINCKDQTIFVERIEMRENGSKKATYIENKTEAPKAILKTDKFYPLYFKYCS
jgi:hypothetical protein